MIKYESEKLLEKKLVKRVQDLGGWCIKMAPMGKNGLPDRMCLFPGGHVAFAEMKTTRQVPTPLQALMGKALIKMGFKWAVLDSTEKINDFLKEYEEDAN